MKIKHKLVLLLGILLLIIITGVAIYTASVPSRYRKIEISTAHKKNLAQSINEEGVVEPGKKQVIEIDPSWKIEEVLVKEGQDVKKGDLVLKLANTDEQYDLEVEEINLKLAERELSKTMKAEKADHMDVVYAVTQSEAAFDKSEAELSSAQRELDRARQLFESGAISKAEYDEAVDNEKNKKDACKLSEMELKIARQALEDFDLDRNEKLFKLQSNIDIIKENLKNLQYKVDAATRADIDGRVVKVDTDKEILIYDIDQYVVNLQLSQQEALYIEEDMSAKVKIKGLEEKEYKGKVTEVDDVATDSRVNMKISIDNADKDLKPGYAVEVKIDLNIKEQTVVVDFESIVQDRDGKKYVYYVKDNVARKVAVTTGIETDYEVEVLEGLIQGDRYVVNPPEDMQEKNSMKIWGWRYESK